MDSESKDRPLPKMVTPCPTPPPPRVPTPPSTNTQEPCPFPPPNSNREEYWNYIARNMVRRSFEGKEQEYLPKPAFDLVTGVGVIQTIIEQDKSLNMTLEDKVKFTNKIYNHCRKLFATCLYCNSPLSLLEALYKKGRTDGSFPLKADHCPDQEYRIEFKTSFLKNQACFNAPFFEVGFFKNFDGHTPIPIQFTVSEKSRRGKGAFGSVYEVIIDEQQHNFPCGPRDAHHFAIKVVEYGAAAQRERDFIDATRFIDHEHSARCFASWTMGGKYYMVYELADCDLQNFIMEYHKGKAHRKITESWLIKNICGLAAALNEVHTVKNGQRNPNSSLTTDTGLSVQPPIEDTRTGYLHDIKLDNILVFKKLQNGLRLCDWSCAKVAEFIASINGQHFHSRHSISNGTITYKPPESHRRNPTGRPYDLWSLGCVYLELLVWFREGYEQVKVFRNSRLGKADLDAGFEDDKFYCVVEGGEKRLRTAVQQKINDLSNVFNGDLKKVLELIPDLLKIDPTERLTAKQLVARLADVEARAQMDLLRLDIQIVDDEEEPGPEINVHEPPPKGE